MSYEYFWAEWIVEPLINGGILHKVVEIAAQNDCYILAKGGWVSDEGYNVGEFVFKAPSRQILDHVLEAIRPYMSFIGFEPATEQDFATGEGIIPQSSPLNALQAINEAGRRNEFIRERNQRLSGKK